MLEKKPKFLSNEDILKNSEELLKLNKKKEKVKDKKNEKIEIEKKIDVIIDKKQIDVKKFEGSDIPWYL